MIVSLSGPKGVGKDTVAKIWHIITENPHFNDDAVLNFIERDFARNCKVMEESRKAFDK